MARWVGRLLLLAIAIVIAWWLLADRPDEPTSIDASESSAEPGPRPAVTSSTPVVAPDPASKPEPHLAGTSAEEAATRRAQEKLRQLERTLNRRGSGAGGFLTDTLLEGTCCITGRVLGADGAPVRNTEVGIFVRAGGSERDLADPDGRFTLEFDVPPTPFRFVALAAGHVPLVLPERRLQEREHVDLGTLRLTTGMRIAGTVVDQDGRPFGATVSILPDDDPVPLWWTAARALGADFVNEAWASAGGRFAFSRLAPGHYRVTVGHDAAIRERVPAGGTGLIVVVDGARAQEPWTIRFRLPPLFDDPSVPQPAVAIVGNAHLVGFERRGRILTYSYRGSGPLGARLDFKETYAPAVFAGLRAPGGTFDVPLRRGRSLRVRVRGLGPDPSSAELVGTGYVHADGTMGTTPESSSTGPGIFLNRATKLDPRGWAEFGGLPEGVLRLRLQGGGYELVGTPVDVAVARAPVMLDAVPKRRLELVFEAPKGASVRAIRYVLSRPSASYGALAHGTLHPKRSGWTEMLELPPEVSPFLLEARADSGRPLAPVRLDVAPGTARLTVRFHAASVVRGRVLDPGGRGLPGVWVTLHPEGALAVIAGASYDPQGEADPSIPLGVQTGWDGSFEVPLPETGQWTVLGRSDGFAMAGRAPRATTNGEMTVSLVPAGRITGRLLAPGKAPMDGHVVTAWPQDGGPGVRVRASDSGFFEIPRLAPGRHLLTAHREWASGDGTNGFEGQATLASVETGARGVGMPLQPSRVARIAIVDVGGKPVLEARVRLRGNHRDERAWATRDDPVFRVAGLAPGRYRFDVEARGRAKQSVQVEAGSTARLVLR